MKNLRKKYEEEYPKISGYRQISYELWLECYILQFKDQFANKLAKLSDDYKNSNPDLQEGVKIGIYETIKLFKTEL